jgi:hypothetical protein
MVAIVGMNVGRRRNIALMVWKNAVRDTVGNQINGTLIGFFDHF